MEIVVQCCQAIDFLKGYATASVDSIVTDPPAGISFMNMNWDNPDNMEGDGSWQYPITEHGYQDGAERVPAPSIGTSSRNPTCQVCGKRERTWEGGPAKCVCEEPRFDDLKKHLEARDKFVAMLREVMVECLRVLKPGGHALVWSLPRTSHWTATAIEEAGFEIREKVSHVYASGMPKSHDISKAIDKKLGCEREIVGYQRLTGNAGTPTQEKGGTYGAGVGINNTGVVIPITKPASEEAKRFSGYGSAMKPAYEDWVLARKPLIGTLAENVLKHGTGGLNIDGCRVGNEKSPAADRRNASIRSGNTPGNQGAEDGLLRPGFVDRTSPERYMEPRSGELLGRWPANFLMSHDQDCTEDQCVLWCPCAILDAQSGIKTSGVSKGAASYDGESTTGFIRGHSGPHNQHGGTGSASRFFFCAKPSRKERDAGLDPAEFGSEESAFINPHPTLKSIDLMRYLCRLVTPHGGLILDPFAGSGTTLCAAAMEGFVARGCEQNERFAKIANARYEYWSRYKGEETVEVLRKTKKIKDEDKDHYSLF